MQYPRATGTTPRRNVPVELIVIGAVIALGVLFANGRVPAARNAPASAESEKGPAASTSASVEEAAVGGAVTAVVPKSQESGGGEKPSAVPMPTGIPAGMPALEGATLVSASADVGAGEYVLTWSVPAEASVAAEDYAVQLEGKGWSVTSRDDNPGSTVLVFERSSQKGGGRGWVAFVGDTPDVSATLTLSLAR